MSESIRSAAATGGERKSKWKCFNHRKHYRVAGSRSLDRHQYTCLTIRLGYFASKSAVTAEAQASGSSGASLACAVGLGVFAARFTSVSKLLAASFPLLASRANRSSVSSRVSFFFISSCLASLLLGVH